MPCLQQRASASTKAPGQTFLLQRDCVEASFHVRPAGPNLRFDPSLLVLYGRGVRGFIDPGGFQLELTNYPTISTRVSLFHPWSYDPSIVGKRMLEQPLRALRIALLAKRLRPRLPRLVACIAARYDLFR